MSCNATAFRNFSLSSHRKSFLLLVLQIEGSVDEITVFFICIKEGPKKLERNQIRRP